MDSMQEQGNRDTSKIAGRDKTWDERNDSERIVLLRQELRRSMSMISVLEQVVQTLSNHGHAADGSMWVPAQFANSNRVNPSRYDSLK